MHKGVNGIIVSPILQLEKLRLGDMASFARDHISGTWRSSDRNPGRTSFRSGVPATALSHSDTSGGPFQAAT